MLCSVNKRVSICLIPDIEKVSKCIVLVSGRFDVNQPGRIVGVNWLKTGTRSSAVDFAPIRRSLRYGVLNSYTTWNRNILSVNYNTQMRMNVKKQSLGPKTLKRKVKASGKQNRSCRLTLARLYVDRANYQCYYRYCWKNVRPRKTLILLPAPSRADVSAVLRSGQCTKACYFSVI